MGIDPSFLKFCLAQNRDTRLVVAYENIMITVKALSSTSGLFHDLRNELHSRAKEYNDAWWLYNFLTTEPPRPSSSLARIYSTHEDKGLIHEGYECNEESMALFARSLLSDRETIRAVVVNHEDSCSVYRDMVDILGASLGINDAFLRQHFDYVRFEEEEGCPQAIKDRVQKEESLDRGDWRLKGRWNSIKLPSKTTSKYYRYRLLDDCVSICLDTSLGMQVGILLLWHPELTCSSRRSHTFEMARLWTQTAGRTASGAYAIVGICLALQLSYALPVWARFAVSRLCLISWLSILIPM